MKPNNESNVTIMFVLIVGIATIAIVFASAPKANERGWPSSQAMVGLKQYATCLNIYLTDNEDRFPTDMSCARSASKFVQIYAKTDSILDADNGVSRELLGNGSLACQDATKIETPDRTHMFIDSAPRKGIERSQLGRITVAVDTSARFAQEPGFQGAITNNWVFVGGKR